FESDFTPPDHPPADPPPLPPMRQSSNEDTAPGGEPFVSPKHEVDAWFSSPAGHEHPNELERLFSEVTHALANGEEQDLFEVSLLQFQPPEDARDEIAVLFDLAVEAVDDPAAEQRYVREIETSEKRKITSEELSRKLAQVEKVFDVPLFSLKSGATQRPGKHAAKDA